MNRHVGFDRLHNFRDLGGYAGADGRTVGWGHLYRSDSLSKLAGDDWDRFQALGVRAVIDLRYPWEIDARGRVPESDGFAYHNLSIEHRPYDQEALDASTPTDYLAERYTEVALDGAVELREALEVIAAQDGPVVFHCASGKDRTGLLAALLLSLLGVAEDDIVADFALTELATERLVADWSDLHEGRAPRWPGYGRAPAEVMSLFLADLNARHGSVHRYVTEHLGVAEKLIESLRERLLTERI